MKKTLFSIFCIALLSLLSLNLFIIKTQAISISPDKYFIDINDQTVVKNSLRLYADEQAKGPETLYLYVERMVKVGEEDDRTFSTPDPANPTEAANFITLSQTQVTLHPGDILDVPWTFTPNAKIQCGTNLAAIVVSTKPNTDNTVDQGSKVSLSYQVISQIHFEVNQANGAKCDNSDRLDFQQFTLDKATPVFNYDGISFTTKIENVGNTISRGPDGFIEIKGFGGKQVIQLNPNYLDIYPSTVRMFSNNWTDPNYPRDGNFITQTFCELTHLKIGRYEATLTLSKNVPLPVSKSVYLWIIPWKVLIFFAIIIAIVVIAVKVIINRTRKKQKKQPSPAANVNIS